MFRIYAQDENYKKANTREKAQSIVSEMVLSKEYPLMIQESEDFKSKDGSTFYTWEKQDDKVWIEQIHNKEE